MPDKERLLEPYVTTRDSGTGLGLAIVLRIAADHGGSLSLHDRDDAEQGAVIELIIPQGDVQDVDFQSNIFITKDASHAASGGLS